MISRKEQNRSTWRRSLMAITLAAPLLVATGFASGVQAGSSETQGKPPWAGQGGKKGPKPPKLDKLTDFGADFECEDVDDFEGPFIVVYVPEMTNGDNNGPSSDGPSPDILIYKGDKREAFNEADEEVIPIDGEEDANPGDTYYFEEFEEGLYTVAIDYSSKIFNDLDNVLNPTATFEDEALLVDIDCSDDGGGSSGGGSGSYVPNYGFSLPKVTTAPVLPSTGSDSSTSMLVLAPLMVLLGGGVLMARRRMIDA